MSADPLETLTQMKLSALFMQVCMMSSDVGEAVAAAEEFEQVVEEFRSRFGEWITAEQFAAACRDVELFLSILQPALTHYRELEAKAGKSGVPE
jgi:hypothetical protein